MRYESVYTMLSDNEPMFLESLTEEQRDILYGVDDYESICYQTDGNNVTACDSLNDDIISVDSMDDFLRYTLEYLKYYEN